MNRETKKFGDWLYLNGLEPNLQCLKGMPVLFLFFFFLYYSIFEDENMEVNSPKVTEANEEVKV